MLLLERPKRAINPQIQRRARALSSRRKAWDVSAGRTNHAASPAEVASSAKPRCCPGYYTRSVPYAACCRQGTPGGSPPRPKPATPVLSGGSAFAPIPPFPTHMDNLPPKTPGGAGEATDLPLASGGDTTACPDKEQRSPAPSRCPASPHPSPAPLRTPPANPHTRLCSCLPETHGKRSNRQRRANTEPRLCH